MQSSAACRSAAASSSSAPSALAYRSRHSRMVCRAAMVRPPVKILGVKTAFITGGNTGIGYETAKELCLQGYLVTIGCRDAVRAMSAIQRISEAVPGATVMYERLDLGDLASVHDCAKRVQDSGVQYDVWINNAGVMYTPKMATKDGFEYQLGINHLGHFALTTEVLPALQEGNRRVRIINVASAAHLMGKLDFGDLMRDRSYDAWEAYGQSKLANVMFTYELARRLGPDSRITANALHPGLVKTELGRYMLEDTKGNPLMRAGMEVFKLFAKTPAQGAATSLYLATSPDVKGSTGKYYVDCKRTTSSVKSYDTDVAGQLWQVSEELTKEKALSYARAKSQAKAK